ELNNELIKFGQDVSCFCVHLRVLSPKTGDRKADGTCRRLNELANKTDTPGRFTFYSQKWNNDNDMRIVEVLYDEYALVYTNKTKDGVSEVLNNLYSRTQEPSVAWQQRFTQFSLDTGILPENIVILPKNETWVMVVSVIDDLLP
uniref:Lipocalin/cytosolic fatty-acid binding domain-containing protein n=1 Tax=Monopterus albus TaxID=43700 RepID=A0A3Q3JEK5_MONAL